MCLPVGVLCYYDVWVLGTGVAFTAIANVIPAEYGGFENPYT
jgi:hypothetical protein